MIVFLIISFPYMITDLLAPVTL